MAKKKISNQTYEKVPLLRVGNDEDEISYVVGIPKRLLVSRMASQIMVVKVNGEWMHKPRSYTFGAMQRLSSDELRSIADKLDELNGVGK